MKLDEVALWAERPGLVHAAFPVPDDTGDVAELRTRCGRTCDASDAESFELGAVTCRSCRRTGAGLAGRVREGAADRPAWWRSIRLNFGRYRNWRVAAVPTDYLAWAWGNLRDLQPPLRLAIAFVLESRDAGDADTEEAVWTHQEAGVLLADVDAVIGDVLKEMARRFAPDLFHGDQGLIAVNAVIHRLRERLGLT